MFARAYIHKTVIHATRLSYRKGVIAGGGDSLLFQRYYASRITYIFGINRQYVQSKEDNRFTVGTVNQEGY